LSSLTSLSLNGHKVRKLSCLAPLVNLKSLDISGNHVDRLDALCTLTNLQSLLAASNRISQVPERLSNLSCLKVLDVSRNIISQPLTEILNTLRSCTQLSSLDISRNDICFGVLAYDSSSDARTAIIRSVAAARSRDIILNLL
jgi:Leucine-rich repeat (LRR) protein